METKYNEPAINRPKGEGIIDAPFVFTDLKTFSKQVREEDAWKRNDRNEITVYKTDDFTMVLTWLHKGALIMDNLLGGLVSMQVLQGAIDFTVESGKTRVEKKQMITIHTGIMHTIMAVEDTLLLITTKSE